MKKLFGLVATVFLVVSIFLALFAPETFADFWVWTGTRIGQAIMALIDELPSDSSAAPYVTGGPA